MEFNATFLATIITFIAFVLLMNKILYVPILSIMQERKDFVEGNYKSAEDNDIRTQALSEEKEELLTSAKDTAKSQYAEALDGYKTKKADIISEAQDSAKIEFENAQSELNRLSDEVKDGLKSSMTDLANDIVEKVIGYRSEVQGFDNDTVSKVLWD